MKQEQKYIVIGAAAIGLVYFGVLDPLLKFLGVKQSADTAALDTAASNPQSMWSPTLWKNTFNAKILTRAAAERLSRDIYDSFGMFNDCEECVISAFKQLSYRTQVSYLADIFYQLYGQDLISFIRGGNYPQDRLSDNDVQSINSFLQKLPLS